MQRHAPQGLSLLLLIVLSGGTLSAQTMWNANPGSWYIAGNWNPAAVPTSSDSVLINNGGLAQIIGGLADSGNISVGDDAQGNLTISSGAILTSTLTSSPGGVIGQQSAGAGTVLVDDATWNLSGLLAAGYGGTGQLTLRNHGLVSSTALVIGAIGSGNGTVTVTDPGSVLTVTGAISVGGIVPVAPTTSAVGRLNIYNLGRVLATQFELGKNVGNSGTVMVDQGELTVSGPDSYVGLKGTGNLNISGLGVVNIGGTSGTGTLHIAQEAGSFSAVTISGLGGILRAAEIAFGAGTGKMEFNQTGTFTLSSNVTGNGSLQLNSGTVVVTGTIANTVSISGEAGSTLQIGNGTTNGTIQANIFSSGTVTVNPAITATYDGNITGTIFQKTGIGLQLLTGTNTITNAVFIQSGELKFAGGTTLAGTPPVTVSTLSGTPAKLTVSDPGTVVNAGATTAGNGGNATTLVANSATLNVASLMVGSAATSTSTVTVDHATLTNTDFSQIGNLGTGSLIVQNGGGYTGNGTQQFGNNSGSSGTFTATGTGTTATLGTTTVAVNGTGAFNLLNGATATVNGLTLSSNASATSTVTISGPGSTLTVSGGIGLAPSGTGTLSVLAGGVLDAGASIIQLARNANSVSRLVVGTNATVIAGTVQFGRNLTTFGNGTVEFASASALSFGTFITGKGNVVQTGAGTTTLTGANDYSLATSVIAGALHAGNLTGSATGTSSLTVGPAGTIGGTGTFGTAGGGAASVSGTVAPGASGPGLLTFGNNLTLNPGSYTLIEIGGLGRGTQFDALNVGGLFTTGGTLQIFFVNAFSPVSGQSFDLFNYSALNGTFVTLTLPSLSPGLSWDSSALYTTGTLSVTTTPVPEPSAYAAIFGAAALGLALLRRNRGGKAVTPLSEK